MFITQGDFYCPSKFLLTVNSIWTYFKKSKFDIKSDNLQYNTLGSMGRSSDVPSIIFFIISCKIFCKNQFIFKIFHNFTKIKIKSLECPKCPNPQFYFQSIKIKLGPSEDWSMRRLTQRPSILYWRLSDLYTGIHEAVNCETFHVSKTTNLRYKRL